MPSVSEFPPLPTPNAAPTGIARSMNGSLWFAERSANKIAQITPAGAVTEYAVPTSGSAPEYVTASPDGYVWFTERYGRKIGRISQSGGPIAEFAVPGTGAFPTSIATDTSGRVWLALSDSAATARIGWISSAGAITLLATGATRTTITGIAAGPDGNLWVTEISSYWGDAVSKMSTSGFGTFTNYRLPNRSSSPQGIAAGSDGKLWFTEKATNKIGQITPFGVLVEFALSAGRGPQQIAAGPDGALWFTEQSGNSIGRITTQGTVMEFTLPTAASQPFGIASDAGTNLYFTEQTGNRIGKVAL